MLSQSKTLIKSSRRSWILASYLFSTSYDVVDIKNSHMIYVKDPNASLPYMSQIKTDKGQSGVVIKLEDKDTAVIGMY